MEADGIKQISPGESTAKEWYATDPETAHGYALLAAKGAPTSGADSRQIVLREEQKVFVDNALCAWKDCGAEGGRRLWDAKMRFGKTVTAYHFIGEARSLAIQLGLAAPSPMKKVLIVTHRPVVDSQWSSEFARTMQDGPYMNQDWRYVSKSATLRDLTEISPDQPVVCFASMQDLRGKEKTFDGFKESNQTIFETHWDLVIIDEAHEGNRTALAQEVHNALDRHFTLYLSGTPYKYLVDGHFEHHEVDVWDYVMEQTAKQEWSTKHPSQPNPYEELPRMWINALDLSNSLPALVGGSSDDSSFNLAEMFSTNSKSGQFERLQDVQSFLDCIAPADEAATSDTPVQMPFLTNKPVTHRHTLWTLPSVAACAAMQQQLEAHPYFSAFTIVNVAGADSGDNSARKALERVREAIEGTQESPLDPSETQTITLTVGRLTTGVTVPQWTAVLLMSNMASAETYMQTIFRVQSAYELGGAQKTECFVYDFAPDRVLRVLSEVTGYGVEVGATNSRTAERRFGQLLNYLPVISNLDSDDFRRMDVKDVDAALKRIYKTRVIEAGFDTGLLFISDFALLSTDVCRAISLVPRESRAERSSRKRDRADIHIAKNDLDNPIYEHQLSNAGLYGNVVNANASMAENDRTTPSKQKEMRRSLQNLSKRIPLVLMAAMSMGSHRLSELKENFSLKILVDILDDESWEEFFGNISKETVLEIEPAFARGVLQVAVLAWIEQIEMALAKRDAGDWTGFQDAIVEVMGRIKNPDKETIFTPWAVVERLYKQAGFEDNEAWRSADRNASGSRGPVTFYDINIKSGLFPLYAAIHLTANGTRSWSDVCNQSIYGNARTLAGKWIACTLLGQPHTWENITVRDINREFESDESKGLDNAVIEARVAEDLVGVLRSRRPGEAAGRMRRRADDGNMAGRRREEKRAATGTPSSANLRFDFLISNPPYQLQQGDGSNSKQIYDRFFFAGRLLSETMCMVFPLGWQKSSGKAAGSVRHHEIREDLQIVSVDNYYENGQIRLFNASTGGVNILVWKRGHDNGGQTTLLEYGQPAGKRDLTITEEFSDATLAIFDHLAPYRDRDGAVSQVVTGWNPFGIRALVMKPDREENVYVYKSGTAKRVPFMFDHENGQPRYAFLRESAPFLKRANLERWKTVFPRHGPYRIWSHLFVVPPGTAVTDRFICIYSDTESEAENWRTYLGTDFCTFLITETAAAQGASQDALSKVYRFIPSIAGITNPRTGKKGLGSDWTDDDLRQVFALSEEHMSHIRQIASRNKRSNPADAPEDDAQPTH